MAADGKEAVGGKTEVGEVTNTPESAGDKTRPQFSVKILFFVCQTVFFLLFSINLLGEMGTNYVCVNKQTR